MKLLSLFSLLYVSLFSLSIAHAAEGDTYSFTWLDPDKEVFVLQNRKFRKAGRLYAMAGGGITTTGAFADGHTFQGRVGYFFREQWGFEVLYAMNSGKENDTAATVRNNDGDGGGGSIPFRRITDNYMGGMFLWSPFYSKINTFNSILYMDWIIGLGIAKIEETNNANEVNASSIEVGDVTESHTGVMWDIGLKFYMNQNWSVRTDFTAIHYQAEKPIRSNAQDTVEKDWNRHYDLTVSLVYDF